ncbi:hypothetical protein ACIU4M_00590 [Bacillus altitudinis]|uniref:hypothetical protein n=1 Tax=Bacillus altitudinis TaxID=293387 RepID=UPI00389A281F
MYRQSESTYELWEIYRDAENEDVFEIVECTIPQYKGRRIKVMTNGLYKAIVKPETDISKTTTESDLVPLYGCYGTARFRKVEEYRKIHGFNNVYTKLNSRKSVFYMRDGEYKRFTRTTPFSDLGDVEDIFDLDEISFYEKVNN